MGDVSKDHQRSTPCSSSDPLPGRGASHHQVTRELLAAWPRHQDLQLLSTATTSITTTFYGLVCLKYTNSSPLPIPTLEALLLPPDPALHPVAAARKLFLLASYLQRLNEQDTTRFVGQLSGDLAEFASGIVTQAVRLVNSNDHFADSIDFVECIMLEAMFYNMSGNLRRAWLTARRGLAVAQMLGLDSDQHLSTVKYVDINTRTRVVPQLLWFRIIQSDRYLSLVLGLQPATQDDCFLLPDVTDISAPLEHLERTIALVGGRIMTGRIVGARETPTVQELDTMLLNAASALPPTWWLQPTLDGHEGPSQSDMQDLESTIRAMIQLAYYHVLQRLHLPFLLWSTYDAVCIKSSDAAVSASRELLARYLSFRVTEPERAVYCRGVDFLAFISCTALCLAYINARLASSMRLPELQTSQPRYPTCEASGHQRFVDRGLMERALQLMEDAEASNHIAGQIAKLLRPLLAIEAEVNESSDSPAFGSISGGATTGGIEYECQLTEDRSAFVIQLPHLGTIRLQRTPKPANAIPSGLSDAQGSQICLEKSTHALAGDIAAPQLGHFQPIDNVDPTGPVVANDFEDSSWAMQGVDLALFDSLFSFPDVQTPINYT